MSLQVIKVARPGLTMLRKHICQSGVQEYMRVSEVNTQTDHVISRSRRGSWVDSQKSATVNRAF